MSEALGDIFSAAADGNCEGLLSCINRGDDLNGADTDGYTPLMWAGSHEEVVVILIEGGADVNQQAPDGTTCLGCCAQDGAVSVSQHLLNAGADVDAGLVSVPRT